MQSRLAAKCLTGLPIISSHVESCSYALLRYPHPHADVGDGALTSSGGRRGETYTISAAETVDCMHHSCRFDIGPDSDERHDRNVSKGRAIVTQLPNRSRVATPRGFENVKFARRKERERVREKEKERGDYAIKHSAAEHKDRHRQAPAERATGWSSVLAVVGWMCSR